MDQNGLGANRVDSEDDLLLRSLPAECVDLVYLDPAFFSSWVHEDSWGGRAPLDHLHRVLKPTGALFLVCDEAVGLYVRVLLNELFSREGVRTRLIWWRADSGPAHHYVFYYRKSAQGASPQDRYLYTVLRRKDRHDSSLVAFSFVQGRRKRRHCDRSAS